MQSCLLSFGAGSTWFDWGEVQNSGVCLSASQQKNLSVFGPTFSGVLTNRGTASRSLVWCISSVATGYWYVTYLAGSLAE